MISLPPEVTFEKHQLPNGGWSYDFRHSTMGALGRILMQGLPGDRATHISCEVAGDPADQRTAERRRIFEPIGLEISRQMEQATGADPNSGPVIPPAPPIKQTEAVNPLEARRRREAAALRRGLEIKQITAANLTHKPHKKPIRAQVS